MKNEEGRMQKAEGRRPKSEEDCARDSSFCILHSSFCIILLAFSLQPLAFAATVTFPIYQLTSAPATNRHVIISPIVLYPDADHVASYDRIRYTTDTNGTFTVSNLLNGLYQAEILAPPDRTTFNFYVPTNALVPTTLNVATLLVADTNITSSPQSTAYSITASDARFAKLGYYNYFTGTNDFNSLHTLQAIIGYGSSWFDPNILFKVNSLYRPSALTVNALGNTTVGGDLYLRSGALHIGETSLTLNNYVTNSVIAQDGTDVLTVTTNSATFGVPIYATNLDASGWTQIRGTTNEAIMNPALSVYAPTNSSRFYVKYGKAQSWYGPNLTVENSTIEVASMNYDGGLTLSGIYATNNITAASFTGDGSGLTNIPGSAIVGGTGNQTPWTSDIDGGGKSLTNVAAITVTNTLSSPVAYVDWISVKTNRFHDKMYWAMSDSAGSDEYVWDYKDRGNGLTLRGSEGGIVNFYRWGGIDAYGLGSRGNVEADVDLYVGRNAYITNGDLHVRSGGLHIGATSLTLNNYSTNSVLAQDGTNVLTVTTNRATFGVPIYGDGSGLTNLNVAGQTNISYLAVTNAPWITSAPAQTNISYTAVTNLAAATILGSQVSGAVGSATNLVGNIPIAQITSPGAILTNGNAGAVTFSNAVTVVGTNTVNKLLVGGATPGSESLRVAFEIRIPTTLAQLTFYTPYYGYISLDQGSGVMNYFGTHGHRMKGDSDSYLWVDYPI